MESTLNNIKNKHTFFSIKVLLVFFVLFFFNTTHSQDKNSVYFTNDYSGLYHGLIVYGKSKKLVKVYIETYNYSFQGINKDRYDKKKYFYTFRTPPEKLFYYIEYYDNKKGKGKPTKTEFFEGYYYNIDTKDYPENQKNELLFYKGIYFTNQDGVLMRNKRYSFSYRTHDRYSLSKLDNGEFEFIHSIGVRKKWKIILEKQNETVSFGNIFGPYISQIKTDISGYYKYKNYKKINLYHKRIATPFSPSGNYETTSLDTDNLEFEGSLIEVKFSNSEIKRLDINNTKKNWVIDLNNKIIECFKHDAQNLKEKLIYYPNVQKIKLLSCKPQGVSYDNFFHSHDILIHRNSFKQIEFNIVPTSLNQKYMNDSQQTTNKVMKAQKKKIQETSEKEEEERLRKINERRKKLENIKQ